MNGLSEAAVTVAAGGRGLDVAPPLGAVLGELAAAGFVDAAVVGRGGFGVVYRCVQSGLGRAVAVKVLTTPVGENRARFVREQHAMAQLTGHPNVVAVLHVGETGDGRPFLVMPLCEHGSVQDRIDAAGTLRVEDVLRLGVKMAGALASAHGVGIVHRDVKPANILFNDFGEPALCDFGIARLSEGGEDVTAAGSFTGSLAYLAPEVISGERPSSATDVYGLGATLFCCLTGHPAHGRREGEQTVAQLFRIATSPAPDLRSYGVADELAAVVEQAMARDPAQRPTAVQLGQGLQQIQAGVGLPVDVMALPQGTGLRRAAVVTPPVVTGSVVGGSRAAAPRRAGSRLPVLAGGLIGRQRETARLCDMVTASRLVTLVGMGGMGKTTLAIHAATELAGGRFTDGVWWVELADLTDGGLLPDVVAAAVGLRDQSGRPSVDVLVEYFAERRALLVLDNCEHLVDEVAKLVDTVLHHCPRVHVLATSREILDINGEALLPLNPLASPAPGEDVTVRGLAGFEAVTLFVQRARAAAPHFELTAVNADAVARICSQLDGLPLAIELAAARMRALSAEQIADGLSDRFKLLNRGRRAVASRQQSLTSCVNWSYDLCTSAEQRLWAQLSVFAGTFVVQAAEVICGGGGGAALSAHHGFDDADLFDQLTALVDKSVLLRSDHDGIVGFRMLETVREFGRSQLSFAERDQLSQRHADYYRQLLVKAKTNWLTTQQIVWLRRITMEVPNIRLALAHALATKPENALHMAHLMYWVLIMNGGMVKEIGRWLDLVLAATPPQPGYDRIYALSCRANVGGLQMDTEPVKPLLAEARRHLEVVTDPAMRAFVETAEGAVAAADGDHESARECLENALATGPEDTMRGWTMFLLGWSYLQLGRPEAFDWFEKALIFSESYHESVLRSHVLFFVGVGRLLTGQSDRAEDALREGLQLSVVVNDLLSGALCLEALAWMAQSGRDDSRRAVVMMAAAAAITSSAGYSRDVWLQSALAAFHDQCEQAAREKLGPDEFAAAWDEGSGFDLNRAVTFTLDAHG